MLLKKFFSITVLPFCYILLATNSYADGTIEGYVFDPDGVAIVGVTITGDPSYSTITDGSGFYTMLHPEGVYSFTASAASGYVSKTTNDVAISTDFTTDLDFYLLEMEITSTYPSLGTLGQSLDIEIRGGGFDVNTRFSLLPDTGNAFSEVGRFTETDLFMANAVKKVGNLAYVVDLAGGPDPPDPDYTGMLYVVDVTNPTKPELLGSVALPGNGRDVDVDGTYAYVTYGNTDTGDGGMVSVDVSNPANPQLKGPVALNVAYGVKVQGSTAYVVDGNCEDVGSYLHGGKLRAIDISTPDTPSLSWTLGLTSQINDDPLQSDSFCALGVDVQNDRVYVANEWGGLQIVDINPGSGTYQTALNNSIAGQAEFKSVKVVDNWVFAAVENDGLQIFNVTNPLLPVLTGSADTPGLARGIDVVNDIAYVADYVGGLAMFDVQDESNPVLLGPIDSEGAALDVVVEGDLAYVADDWYGLQILNVSDPQKPTMAGSIISIEGADVLKEDDTLYVTDSDGLHIITVADPTAPVISSSIPFINGAAMRMVKSGDTMYVASYDVDLQIVNLLTSDITPVDISSNGSNRSWAVDVDSSFIYVADGNCDLDTTTGGLTLIDKTNTTNQWRVALGGCATDVVVDKTNKLAYVTVDDDNVDDRGLKVIDVDPTHVTPPSPTAFLDLVDFISTDGSPLGLALSGSYAYVAAGWEGGLEIIDITTPSNLQSIASTGTLGHEARDVKLNMSGTTAYVADFDAGVYVVDVTTKSNPLVVGWADTPGFAVSLVAEGLYAYVADSFAGLTIVPLPYEFLHTPGDEWKVTASLPSPPIEGNYRMRAFHNSKSSDSVLEGAITFVSLTTAADLLTSKAIIVAGGGPSLLPSWNNLIWDETKAYANQAYDNLLYQGYKHEDIKYLTDEPNALARYDLSAQPATRQNLQNAITSWANSAGTSGLLLFMEDHGNTEEFILNGATGEKVTAAELDSWLDTLQATMPGKVIFINDACRSGSFIFRNIPPAGRIRITLTSAAPDQAAYFLSNNHSFSSHFWSTFTGKAGSRAIMTEAYNRASSNMVSYQTAQLDANGNGIPNEPEDYTALESYEGTIFSLRREYNFRNRSAPVIPVVSPDQSAPGSLWVQSVYDTDGDIITRVWAEIYGPDFNEDETATTVTGSALPSVILAGPDVNDTYTQDSTPDFTVHGTYIITYYAEDSSGIYSLPKTSLVTQDFGTDVLIPDQYEGDDTFSDAKVIVPNNPTPQNHSFHVDGDQDWVKFYGIAGQVYNVRAMNPTLISDPVITIYNSDLVVQGSSNIVGSGQEESIVGWICPVDGTYYVKLTNSSTHFGANVRYKLKVYNPIALSLPGYITGRITSGGIGVAGAIVRAGGGTAITLADGSYIMYLMPGSYSVSVSCPGYQSSSFSASVSSGGHTSLPNVDVNSIPRIINMPSSFIKANELYNFTPIVVEPDGDPYTFSIQGKPSWASFSTVNGSFWGRPSRADEGVHGPIAISVTDNVGAKSSIVFNIVVMEGTSSSLPAIYYLLLKP